MTTSGTAGRKRPAYATIADEIRARILSGEFQPGERIPQESELIEQYGSGRGTIREAIRLLESSDLVHTTRGVSGGTFVSAPSIEAISAKLQTGVALLTKAEQVTVEQLMDVRQLTEVPAAGRAAHHRTDEHLTQMQSTFQPASDMGTYAANQDFHIVMLKAAANPLLELVTAPMFRVLQNRFDSSQVPPGYRDAVDAEHRRIYEAIAAGDSMTAMTEMRRHLDHFDDAFRSIDSLATAPGPRTASPGICC